MGFLNIRQYADADAGGRLLVSTFRKAPTVTSSANWWSDVMMLGGNPPAQYYATTPYVSAILGQWDGIFHGDVRTPKQLYLADMMLCANNANLVGQYELLDYLLYYPFVDLDDASGPQSMTQAAPLPTRAPAGGVGLQVMIVCQAPTAGGGSFTFNYLNQLGQEHTSAVHYYNTSATGFANLVHFQAGSAGVSNKFLRLNDGDTGITAITSHLNLTGGTGGLGAYVLVGSLADITVIEANTANEVSFINRRPGCPQISDMANLNFICNTAGSLSGNILTGRLNFIQTE